MASSRIFVKGLPPTFTDTEFKKHFGQNSTITDAKIFPNRRIGYVGYKTPEDAQRAVKYFNKSFIRMSRIGVELARPVQDGKTTKQIGTAPTSKKVTNDRFPATQEGSKRKREDGDVERDDTKLKEFLNVMQPKSKKRTLENMEWEGRKQDDEAHITASVDALPEDVSDEDYEDVPSKSKRVQALASAGPKEQANQTESSTQTDPVSEPIMQETQGEPDETGTQAVVSDLDWARSRTSRLLGLLDEDEEAADALRRETIDTSPDANGTPEDIQTKEAKQSNSNDTTPTPSSDHADDPVPIAMTADVLQAARASMRLFVRNLPYDVKEEDLEAEFAPFGNLDEIHVPRDLKTGAAKGFAYIQYWDADSAESAMQAKDGQTFQGRLLHILPADSKRETKLDDFALSKLPLKKQQQIKKRREAASTTFNWNALYMNADAVVSSVADRLGLSKSEVLDPTSGDAAIKQAHAETHIIQETKAYFMQHGVDLDSFKRAQRGDTSILVKNIPYDCSKDELKRLFEEHGELKKFLMPPSGVIAIVEFANAAQCKAAFGALAYRKVKSSVLFLEKAPKGIFDGTLTAASKEDAASVVTRTSAFDLKSSRGEAPEMLGTATLFVRNLNFSTTTPQLIETFRPLEGFLSARVKTKTDPKRPDEILSMGFGFLEFRTSQQAQAALKAMDGYNLDGHKLQIRASHKGADAAEQRRAADAAKKAAGKKTKVVIKNLPFEASKKDVRALFGAYGQLRSVRVPKKYDRAARGFAFADFTTPKEAESAMDALKDTHLLGRRLVLDFAAEDPEDAEAEIEKMQQKVGAQVNKVALQKLTSSGRKKFSTQAEDDVEGN